jgi:hypothetical protein
VARRLVDATLGSPLAIVEVASALSEDQLAGGRPLPAALPLGSRLEGHYRGQVDTLPADTRSFLLIAAADSSGDRAVLHTAARSLGLPADSAEPAVRAGLLESDGRVQFRHPLIRSAVYSGADGAARRIVHRALADAIDAAADPEGRVWHLASSAAGPDDAIADELATRADRARERGGFATAAALRTRAAELTQDRDARAERLLEAARAHHVAGAFPAAAALLAEAERDLGSELHRAEARRVRAALRAKAAPGEVPAILLDAAERLVTLDATQARETFGEAIQACLVSWQFTAGTSPAEVARIALGSGLLEAQDDVTGLLRRGFATRLGGEYSEAVGFLRRAVAVALVSPSGAAGSGQWEGMAGLIPNEVWDADDAVALVRSVEADERERGPSRTTRCGAAASPTRVPPSPKPPRSRSRSVTPRSPGSC